MKQWESKFLPRNTAAGAIIIEAKAATETRTHVGNNAREKGATIMAAGTGIAANPTPMQALKEAGGNGSTDLPLPARLFPRVIVIFHELIVPPSSIFLIRKRK